MNIHIFFSFFILNVVSALQVRRNFQKCLAIPLFRKNGKPKVLPEKNNIFINNSFFRNELNIFKRGFNIFRKKYCERSIEEKLSIIPVYVITNFSNSPYIFQEREKQVCYLFLCPHDAEEMLQRLIKNNNFKNTKNIKIHSIHMGKAHELIEEMLFLKSLKNGFEHTQKNMVYWKLIPSKKQVQNSLIYLTYKKKSDFICPVFYIKDFYIKKDEANITPLFFSMEDLKSIFEEQFKNRSINNCEIKVANFVDLIFSDAHKYFGFVPSFESVEYAQKLKHTGLYKTYF